MRTLSKNIIWIGVVELTGTPTNAILEKCEGAISVFLTVANTRRDFLREAEKEASVLELKVVEILWAEPLQQRLKRYEVDDDILDKAARLKCKGEYCEFHVWEREDSGGAR